MTKLLLSLLLINTINTAFSQNIDYNKGGTKSTDYYIELPYENISGKIIIEVEINKKPRRFLLDTGSPTVLSSSLINETNQIFTAKTLIRDSQGNTDSLEFGKIDKIKIGNIDFENIPVLLSPRNILFECFSVEGIIGSNLLRNSIIQFNTNKNFIILTDNIQNLKLPEKHSIKIVMPNPQSSPYIRIHFNKKGSEEILFDSGSDTFYDLCMNHYKLLSRHNVYTDSIKGFGSMRGGIFGTERMAEKIMLKINSVKIGKAKIKNIRTITNSDRKSKIGTALFKYGKVTVDYINKKFYFEPFKKTQKYKEKFWPLFANLIQGKLLVTFVWNNYADKINIGDEIIEINGKPVNPTDICGIILHPIFEGKTELVITLKEKDGTVKKIRVFKK